MSSNEAEKLQGTGVPRVSQCTEPLLKEVSEGDVPIKGTASASNGTTPQSTSPQTTMAIDESVVNTPSRSLKDEEPQPKVPRMMLNEGDVSSKIREARLRIQQKREVLRKLNMAKTYRTKWETQDLGTLTDQWLEVCQTALEDLRAKLKESFVGDAGQQELTLRTLMDSLGIDPELVHLNEEEDCFFS